MGSHCSMIKDLSNETKTDVNKHGIRKKAYKESGEKQWDDPSSNEQANDIKMSGETAIIKKLISTGNVVFDIGANRGAWTKEVLKYQQNVAIHLFEPAHQTYHELLKNLSGYIEKGLLTPNCLAIGKQEAVAKFNFYEDAKSWSTFYRRVAAEKQTKIKPPVELPVFMTTLDNYCDWMNIRHINFIKVDVEGAELDVLLGATELLRKGRIDYLQFEYGGTYIDAGITLRQVANFLNSFRYDVFKINQNTLEYKRQISVKDESFKYCNYLAVNRSLCRYLTGASPEMLDIKRLCRNYSIVPNGVIHVGAHEGGELKTYLEMNIKNMLLIEANPEVYEKLVTNMSGLQHAAAVNCAISDLDGMVSLNVTSMDQSSSIMPLKIHKEIYPTITECHQITVPSKTLDSLIRMEELKFDFSDFNILSIDIQGAELLALKGATECLKYIDAINIEVNYQELYEGGALVHELDDFLEHYGFECVETTRPYHPSWGDAFYVKKPVITMSTLGTNGRFANQVFQYAFLRIYAKTHNLRIEIPDWVGQYLFGHRDDSISKLLPVFREETNELNKSRIPNTDKVFKNVDFWGWFQYHTKFYAPHKDFFRSLFQPVPEVEKIVGNALKKLRSKGKNLIGLHLRRGDYGYDRFFISPTEWYKEWLRGFWETIDEPVLYIASDDPSSVIDDFLDYDPITGDFFESEVPGAQFYLDFYILSQCDAVAISNSSFSFAACMLNENANFFFRPHLPSEKLIPFDPWNSEVIFTDVQKGN